MIPMLMNVTVGDEASPNGDVSCRVGAGNTRVEERWENESPPLHQSVIHEQRESSEKFTTPDKTSPMIRSRSADGQRKRASGGRSLA
ncbi:hypothetical protein F2P81_022559 [Scophthalmus maximus]|uniref:Uncharacterized protein n=1 Tax=Scophthalmus maximus TaxID=52904 RepID=A0A6A4S0L8_SCOMX|nr:hypothetical protein F2P81_022559 [Scophthalmus maximus]